MKADAFCIRIVVVAMQLEIYANPFQRKGSARAFCHDRNPPLREQLLISRRLIFCGDCGYDGLGVD